jgi:hypothetical protein
MAIHFDPLGKGHPRCKDEESPRFGVVPAKVCTIIETAGYGFWQ